MKQKKTNKKNKNEIISYKKSKKINQNRLQNYVTEYHLFGGGYNWEKFKQSYIYKRIFNKISFKATLLVNQKKKIEKDMKLLLNTIVILNNFIARKIIKRVIRLFNFIKISSFEKKDKKKKKRIKKNRKLLWKEIFGINYNFNIYKVLRERDMLSMKCKNFKNIRVECLIKEFRRVELKFNKKYNKYIILLEDFNASYSNKYKKILNVISDYSKYEDKLNKKTKMIVAKAKEEVDNINNLDKKLESIFKECNDYKSNVNAIFNKSFPFYGFIRYENFIGLKINRNYIFRTKSVSNKVLKNKKTREDYTNFYKNEQINILSNLIFSIKKYRSNNINNNINKNQIIENINKYFERLISNNVFTSKELARRDMGQFLSLTTFKLNEMENILPDITDIKDYDILSGMSSDKKRELKINRQFRVPNFIERIITDFQKDSNPNKNNNTDSKINMNDYQITRGQLGIRDGTNNDNKIYPLPKSCFLAMIYRYDINYTQDIIFSTLLHHKYQTSVMIKTLKNLNFKKVFENINIVKEKDKQKKYYKYRIFCNYLIGQIELLFYYFKSESEKNELIKLLKDLVGSTNMTITNETKMSDIKDSIGIPTQQFLDINKKFADKKYNEFIAEYSEKSKTIKKNSSMKGGNENNNNNDNNKNTNINLYDELITSNLGIKEIKQKLNEYFDKLDNLNFNTDIQLSSTVPNKFTYIFYKKSY